MATAACSITQKPVPRLGGISQSQKEPKDKVKSAVSPLITKLPWEVPVGDYYMVHQPFAAGTSATIHNGRDPKTGHPLVMKRFFTKPNFEIERDAVQLLSQTGLLHGVKVYQCSPSSDKIRNRHKMDSEFSNTIVMKKVPALSIEDQYLIPRSSISSHSIKSILRQLLEHCKIVHKAGVVNLDLKPRNMIWHEKSRSLWVLDYSLARKVSELEGFFPIVQTVPYRAPEVYVGFPYCAGTDIWSIPFIIYDLVVGTQLGAYSTEDVRFSEAQLITEAQKQIEALTVLFLGIPETSFLDACDPAAALFFNKYNGQYWSKITKFFHRFTNWRAVFSKAALAKGFTHEEIEEMLSIFKRVFVWDPRNRPSAEAILTSKLFNTEKQFTCKLPKGWKVVFLDKREPVLTIAEDSASRDCFHLPMIEGLTVQVFDEQGQKVNIKTFNINDGDRLNFCPLAKRSEEKKRE
ncbi:MAG TPA: serine/threonine-protein kinase [Chlamydiales bacterium]|nr:serine/threonine-protein kinase [Chlamydiales bacterium]